MKLLWIILITLPFTMFFSCENPGTTTPQSSIDNRLLPPELKGLKVYEVWDSPGTYIKVAVLNNQVVSTAYKDGKYDKSIIILNTSTNKTIEVKEILMENDSLIMCRK